MLNRLKTPTARNITILIVILSVVALVGLFIDRVSDPLVNYYGVTMRQSNLVAQSDNELFCQQLASFSFGPNFTCFDSKQELDDFAASRSE